MQGDNPVERMSRCVEVVHSSDNGESAMSASLDALDHIIDLVDNIDNAMGRATSFHYTINLFPYSVFLAAVGI